jgi:hypothetical protein
MANAAPDQWTWWREALQGHIGPVHENNPQSGFYRHFKGHPVAIWRDDEGGIRCLVDGVPTEDKHAQMRAWIECARKPVTRLVYNARRNSGAWGARPEDVSHAPAPRTNVSSDPYQALLDEIADKLASAATWLRDHPQATTSTESDYARNLQAELLALNKRADGLHKAEKAPVLEQSRAIDERFRIRETVAGQAAKLRTVFEQFMIAEEARQRAAAQRKFEVERQAAIAEGQRVAAERAKQLEDDPIAALTSREPALPVMPTAPDPVKVKAGGGVGRAAGLKSEWVGEVEDYGLALSHFAQHADVKELVRKLADKAVKAAKGDIAIAGVKVVEKRRAA